MNMITSPVRSGNRLIIINHLMMYLRHSLRHDECTLLLLLWLVKQTKGFTVPVALSMHASDLDKAARTIVDKLYTSGKGLLIGEHNVFNMNHMLQRWGEDRLHFTFARGEGYKTSVIGTGKIRSSDMEGWTSSTVWFAELSHGQDPVSHQPDPNLQILTFPGWHTLRSELESAGMLGED